MALLMLGGAALSSAQPEAEESDLLEMSIEELLEVEVTSAAKSPKTLREAPAIVTVISADPSLDRGYQSLEIE